MIDYGIPAGFALLVWWLSTGIIIFLDLLPRRTHRASMIGMSVAALAAVACLATTARLTGPAALYVGFTAGVVLWGWHEMSFFMGFVTGPRRAAATPGAGLARRFGQGVLACLWHELAIIGTAVGIVALTAGGPNQIGTWTFLALWAMRQSAKINVFLGVRNLGEAFLPPHLRFIGSYMRRARMNWLMPLSLVGGAYAARALVLAAGAALPAEIAGLVFLATMTILGVVEHACLVLPLPFEALWSWFARRKQTSTRLHATRAAA